MKLNVRRFVHVLAAAVVAGGSGLLVRGQSPQLPGTWASSGPVADARAHAASAMLPDGRTVVAGGFLDGAPTARIVVFDPLDHSFATAGAMSAARVGHTATVLADGRVLIAGGLIDGLATPDLEIYDPAAGTSAPVGTMGVVRSGHAAALLDDGTVLLVGGSDGTAALPSGEIFHADSMATTSINTMSIGRAGASATTLIDGRVLVAGGNDGTQDLATAEIFNPWSESFEPVSASMTLARSGHSAVLLPHNAGVLIAGGSTNGVPQIASDLFLPAIFTDPYSYAQGTFVGTGAMATPRMGAIAGPEGDNGYAFVASGTSVDQNGQGGVAANAERYRFATIKTDKDDYAPGEHAVITGSGWQPGEQVTLLFQDASRPYGDANAAFGATFAGFKNGQTLATSDVTGAPSLTTTADASTAVGAHAITAALGTLASVNYDFTFVDGTLTITARALTITANSQSKTYGDVFTFTGAEFAATGLTNSDAVNSVTLTSAGAAVSATVGAHPIVATNAVGTGLSNYVISYVDGTFTVNAKALTITASNQSKTYGDTFAFAGTEFTTAGLTNSDAVNGVTLTSAATAATAAVGPHPIVASNAVGTGLSNYAITYVDGTFAVNAKALTVTASNQSKTYGDTFTFTGTEFTTAGLTNSDAVNSVTLESVGAPAAAGIGPYSITPSAAVGNGLSNYSISYVAGALTVNARTLTITANNRTKVYGQTVIFAGTEFTTGAGQLVNGDTVASVTLMSVGAAATARVTAGPTYPITPSAAVGTGLGNYDVHYAIGTLTITIRTLTLSFTGVNKPYDGTNAATVTATDDRINNDTFTINRTATFLDPNAGPGKTVNVTAISLADADAGNYALPSTAVKTTATITPAATTTTSVDVTTTYNEFDQAVQLKATVSVGGAPAVNQGKVKFTVTDPANGNAVVGTPVEMNVSVGGGGTPGVGGATQAFLVPGMTGVGVYKVTAAFSSATNYANSTHDPALTIVPDFFQTETANMDADFHQIDGFDVLFGKGNSNSTLELKNTNPGTMHYRLTLSNSTGVVINAANDNTARAVIEVPSMINCGGVSCPSGVNPGLTTLPAWVLKGRKSVRVRPDDQTDDLPLEFRYKASGACTLNPADYSTTLPADSAPRCIMVSGFALPKRHKARLDINFEFRWKKTDGWSASPDAKLLFRTGFAFKSTVALTWQTPTPTTKVGYFSVGLVGAGQKVSAVGGFAFDNVGAALAGYKVRLFNNATDTVAVAEDTATTDGFYFIWKKGTNQMNAGAVDLPSNVKYVVRLYDGSGTLVATKTMSDKLGPKEFDEEDFYVTP